jgi:hypothetical protein
MAEKLLMVRQKQIVVEGSMIRGYRGPGGDVVLPEGITEIGDYAFSSGTNLTSITLPSSLG